MAHPPQSRLKYLCRLPTSAAILKRDEESGGLAEEQLNVGKRQVDTGTGRRSGVPITSRQSTTLCVRKNWKSSGCRPRPSKSEPIRKHRESGPLFRASVQTEECR